MFVTGHQLENGGFEWMLWTLNIKNYKKNLVFATRHFDYNFNWEWCFEISIETIFWKKSWLQSIKFDKLRKTHSRTQEPSGNIWS